MSDHLHPDCNNKESAHYFMYHMPQEEFEYLSKDVEIRPHKFNLIRRLRNGEKINDLLKSFETVE